MRPFCGTLVGLLLITPAMSHAQPIRWHQDKPADEKRQIFIDLNVVGATRPLGGGREFTSLTALFSEPARMNASYPKPSGSSAKSLLDVGGGLMMGRWWGIGVSFDWSKYEGPVGLVATIPHPTYLDARATGTGTTDRSLSRRESATHLFFTLATNRTRRSQLRMFGGPSFFSYAADMVTAVQYSQTFSQTSPSNAIKVTGFDSTRANARGLGFNAGADYAYFVKKRLGFAVGGRFSSGIVRLKPEPLSKVNQEIRTGERVLFAGVRLRVGG